MRKYFCLALVLAPLSSFCQFKKINSFVLNDTVASVAVDRPGDLYLNTIHNGLQKFDGDGNMKLDRKNNPVPDLFDPRDGARMFAFYRQTRQYAYLNPEGETLSITTLDSAFALDPWLACASGDLNIWVVDAADQSLKKINTRIKRIEAEVKLSASIKPNEILYLREYQGFLFLLSKECDIHIFNSMGKSIKIISSTTSSYFNFLGEELYYLYNNRLKFFDLFSTETREINLPLPCTFALLTDERLYLVKDASMVIFDVKK